MGKILVFCQIIVTKPGKTLHLVVNPPICGEKCNINCYYLECIVTFTKMCQKCIKLSLFW